MESDEDCRTAVLYPDSNCSLLNNLLDNINDYVLKVHEHCLTSSQFPPNPIPRKDEEVSPGGCRLCTAAVDGIPVSHKKSSRTFGVDAAEDAYEYHQRGGDERPKNVCEKTANNVYVKVKQNDKEVIEWFRKTHARHVPTHRGTKLPAPVEAPFKVRVTPTTRKEDIELDLLLERTAGRKTNRRVSFQDEAFSRFAPRPNRACFNTDKPSFSWAKPALTKISKVFQGVANMFNCSRKCQCEPQPEQPQPLEGTDSEKSYFFDFDEGNSWESMANLVVTLSDTNGEERYVRLNSWDNKIPACDPTKVDLNTAKDILEILRHSDQSTSKQLRD